MFLFRPPFPTPKNYFVNFKRRKTEVLKTLNWTFEVLAGDIRDCLIFENELISKSFRSKLKTCKKAFQLRFKESYLFSRGWHPADKSIKEFWNVKSGFFWGECIESRNLIHNELIAADAFVIIQKLSRNNFWSKWKFELYFQFLRRLCVEKRLGINFIMIFLGIVTKLISIKFCNRTMKEFWNAKSWWCQSVKTTPRQRLAIGLSFPSWVTLEFQSPWLSLNLTEPDCNSKSLLARGQS